MIAHDLVLRCLSILEARARITQGDPVECSPADLEKLSFGAEFTLK